MMNGNQKQIAGNNSCQQQAQIINNYNGITEERAREIFNELITILKPSLTKEAYFKAKERITEFEEVFIPKIINIEKTLDAFADPSFQISLAAAHRTAAASGRKDDYEILSELLKYRMEKPNDREIITGIRGAIEIVDQIEDKALCGVTLIHSFLSFIPCSSDLETFLSTLDDLYSKLMYTPLPEGNNWIDHLEILNVIRILPFSKMFKPEDLFSHIYDGHICVGIKKDSENYKKALDILAKAKISPLIFSINPFLSNYVKLRVANQDQIKNFYVIENCSIKEKISDIQINALHEIYKMYDTDQDKINYVNKKFIEMWNNKKYLNIFCEWTKRIPQNFSLTAIGKAISHANAQQCEPSLPRPSIIENQ